MALKRACFIGLGKDRGEVVSVWWSGTEKCARKVVCVGNHTAILSKKPRYIYRIIREADEIEINPNNMNRDDGFCLRK
jgi:hypothetical protein